MSDDTFNMTMRKFLKQVGVTSQQAIEEAMRAKGNTDGLTFEAKVVLTIDGLDMEHVVTGKIEGKSATDAST
jgi:metal-dependent HD superfamily phosphatase/phosphodiesterase|tara:strand:+ start:454 stop:669 length:216 start_codon:yes stop_codon:yes gene_type:complete